MNREQRRSLEKQLRSRGISKDDIAKYIEMQKSNDKEFAEGEKVKLNYEQITMHPDYIKNKDSKELQVVKHHEFVENNKDKVLTVKYSKDHERHPHLLELVEDDFGLLFWKGDLEKFLE